MKEKLVVIDKLPLGGNLPPIENVEPEQSWEVMGNIVSSLPFAFEVADRSWDQPILKDETEL